MAEGEQLQWLDGQANVPGIVEKICPKKHIRQDQWKSKWNKMFLNDRSKHCYDYISDYECIFSHPIDSDENLGIYKERWCHLQDLKQKGTNVCISNLAHFTTESKAEAIIRSGGFRGGEWEKINKDAHGDDIKAKFSWWCPKFDENDITKVRDTLGGAISPFLGARDDQDTLQSQFATSDAFIPNRRRYGYSYFQYDIKDLCQYYGTNFYGKVQFKILGTFSYKQEVMHVVLVCSEANGAGMFRAYPDVLTPEEDVNNEAVVTRDDDGWVNTWIWKPQATGTEITRLCGQGVYPKYRRWEHVAFAFHIPDEWGVDRDNEELMVVPELENNLHDL